MHISGWRLCRLLDRGSLQRLTYQSEVLIIGSDVLQFDLLHLHRHILLFGRSETTEPSGRSPYHLEKSKE